MEQPRRDARERKNVTSRALDRVRAARVLAPPRPSRNGAGELALPERAPGRPVLAPRRREEPRRLHAADAPPPARPEVRGKFIYRGDEKLCLRGVTYGTFGPGSDDTGYPSRRQVEADFDAMERAGINSVRTYTPPPTWLLDTALRHGIVVMVGLPWEQHVAFLDDRERVRSIEERVAAAARRCANHPAVLALAIGNEIPAPIVRWLGRRRVERFLERLYLKVKEVDPGALVTYVNFPSTEYLQLPFLDFVSFNVYLEQRETLEAYLDRLQNLAGNRPLVMAEVGLDSRRNGHERQAEVLEWQIQAAFERGCAGTYVFAWTDEWHRGGFEIDDWDFGLVDRRRRPKPALEAVRRAFAEAPFPKGGEWPRISVVVCSYNGEATIGETLEHTARLDYPDYEVIVVDDGSSDGTREIAREHDCRVVSVENGGLSAARNVGAGAATGEVIAYLDDDAYPDTHWLRYLGAAFRSTDFCAIGGPNIPPGDDGPIAECVGHAPGGPIHVLTSDRDAEHIPGCNLAVRRECFEAIGGFDPEFRVAGDDVDFCWRLQAQGWKIGFDHAATVFHHRRNSIRAYWRQQRGYGRAEALLERKWPEKYNEAGHVSWSGRLYGGEALTPARGRRWRVYYGTWGTAAFQSLYDRRSPHVAHLPLMPEWYLVLAALAGIGALGALWAPLLVALPLLAFATGAVVAEGLKSSRAARLSGPPRPLGDRFRLRALTFAMYLMQPAARLRGRLRSGLTPWRHGDSLALLSPRSREWSVWEEEEWRALEQWVQRVEMRVRVQRVPVVCGGAFDPWDLEARGGVLGAARLRMTVEEHGAGKQLVRFAAAPRVSRLAVTGVGCAAAIGLLALLYSEWIVASVLLVAGAVIAIRTVTELAVAIASFQGRAELG